MSFQPSKRLRPDAPPKAAAADGKESAGEPADDGRTLQTSTAIAVKSKGKGKGKGKKAEPASAAAAAAAAGGEEVKEDAENAFALSSDGISAFDAPAKDEPLDVTENPWLAAIRPTAGLTPEMAMSAFTRKSDKRMAKLQRSRVAAPNANATLDAVAAPAAPTPAAAPAVPADAAASTAATSGAKGKAGKSKGGAGQAESDKGTVEGDKVDGKAGGAKGKGKGGKATAEPASLVDEDEAEAADASLFGIGRTAAQRNLVREAFAGDNVVEEEFAATKAALVDGETVKDKDITLPGWGAWGGVGTDPSKQRKIIQKAPPAAPRKDGKLKHVIINQKEDSRLAALRVSSVPFPYTAKEQFERNIRTPVGPEWNTFNNFREMSKPRISTQAGAIIAPMTLTKSIVKAGQEAEVARAEAAAARMKRNPKGTKRKQK